jgi:hypothetical protein
MATLARAGANRDTWRAVAAPYGWPAVAPRYDALFGDLAKLRKMKY